MYLRTYYDLYFENGGRIFLTEESLESLKEELNGFLSNNKDISEMNFSDKILLSQAIKFNNTIEGYKDDISTIDDVIGKYDKGDIVLEEEQIRIINCS